MDTYRAFVSYSHQDQKLAAVSEVLDQLPDLKLAEQVLMLQIALRWEGEDAIKHLCSTWQTSEIEGPVVVVCGGTDSARLATPAWMANLVNLSFEGYTGNIICGGIACGISAHVGNLHTLYRVSRQSSISPVAWLLRHRIPMDS